MSTAPYLSDTPTLLETSLGQTFRVEAVDGAGVSLGLVEVDECSISFDETRAPRVLARLSARVPENGPALAQLDPRTGSRLRIWAGYLRPDDVDDVHMIADLSLRVRQVNRPGNVLDMTAASDEAILLEMVPAALISASTASTRTMYRDLLFAGLGRNPPVVITLPDAVPDASTLVEADGDLWAILDAEVNKQAGDIYDNGLRTFYIVPTPVLGTPVHTLKVGARGTLTSSSAALDREGFYNAVVMRYEWRNAQVSGSAIVYTYKSLTGRAEVTSGPFMARPGNRVVLREIVDYGTRFFTGDPITKFAADTAAAAKLSRGLSRGRSLSLEAISALWLRPGHTVETVLPLGGTERHLVSDVTFDLRAGRMTVGTRRPGTDLTSTQGA